MGKGDRKTAKGKRAVRSYGNKRPHSAKKAVVKKSTTSPAAKPAVKKAPPARKKA